MSAAPRTARVLDVLSVICVVVTVWLLLWPLRPAVRPLALTVPSAVSVAAPVAADSIAGQIVATNIFASSRRAPRTRFVPPGAEPVGILATPSASEVGPGGDPSETPRLFGIIAQDGARRALLQLPGADSTPRLFAIGERQGGYRVVSIGTDRVVLASAAGSRTVRLVSRTKSDSLENQP